jgi:tetratricopeptide (TPR) repeat protein
VDETAISIRGGSRYLYRAVDKFDKTVDSLLADRSVSAARAFFCKALKTHYPRQPQKLNLDGYAASHRALRLLVQENPDLQSVVVRSSRYLNNIVEQDHRAIKRRCEALVTTGAIADADDTIEQALTLQRQTHEKYTFPELLRIKAKVLQARGFQELAEQKLREALASAEEMGARSLQLRVACDLAELWIAEGRQRPARALLRPIYKAFSEGLNTRDLRRATSLLGRARELTSTSTTP